jgi:hypothetical protein
MQRWWVCSADIHMEGQQLQQRSWVGDGWQPHRASILADASLLCAAWVYAAVPGAIAQGV